MKPSPSPVFNNLRVAGEKLIYAHQDKASAHAFFFFYSKPSLPALGRASPYYVTRRKRGGDPFKSPVRLVFAVAERWQSAAVDREYPLQRRICQGRRMLRCLVSRLYYRDLCAEALQSHL